MRVSIYGTWQLRQMNTLVFLHWSVNCFPCLRSILFSLGWSKFRTCFRPEDSFCLNKFCSSPTADVEAGVIVARKFSFLHLAVSLCRSSFFFFKKKTFTLSYFLWGTNDHHFCTILLSYCFLDLYYFYFLIIYFMNSTGLSLRKRTNSCPRWPHSLLNRRLPCHVISSGQRRWIQMRPCWKAMQEKCFCLAVVICHKLLCTTICTSENQVAVFKQCVGRDRNGKDPLRLCSAPCWAGSVGLCRSTFVCFCV